jgi:hypothetical protein
MTTGEINGFRGTTVSAEYGIGSSVARRGSLLDVHESLEALADPPELPLSALTICALDRLARGDTLAAAAPSWQTAAVPRARVPEIEDSPDPWPAPLGTCESKPRGQRELTTVDGASLVSVHTSGARAAVERPREGDSAAQSDLRRFLAPQGNGLEPSVQDLFVCVRQDSEGEGGYAGDL